MFQNVFVGSGQWDFSALHCFFCHFVGFVESEFFVAFHSALRKTIYKIWLETGLENIRRNTNDSSCVELRVNCCFGMIAHYQSTKLQTCVEESFLFEIPKFD